MDIELKKLDFKTVLPRMHEMYRHLEVNRERLAPWFWWASSSVTPNRASFSLFVIAYILSSDVKKIAHKFNPKKLYDEQFVMFADGKVAGMCGLDNIDIKNNKNAELWFLTFKNNPFGIADTAIKQVEEYSININLNSLYAHVQPDNEKSKKCLSRNNYTVQAETKNALVAKMPDKFAPVYVFDKVLTKGQNNGR